MNKNTLSRLFLITILISPIAFTNEFSAMTLNVDNLFDTLDDKNKDDKAYLPIEAKTSKNHIKSCNRIKVKSWKNECLYLDWDIETKNVKLKNLASNIISYDRTGADIIALQEVENLNILNQLFDLLEPYGYQDLMLLEGKDYRGIDTALISKYKILDAKLHYITFSGKFEGKDTRPILDATIDVNGSKVKIYNVHFPSGFHDVSMRIDSLNLLSELLENHNYPTIALGDFNVNTKEDTKLNIYKSQEKYWSVAHLEGCEDCKGSYYYNYGKAWEYLDTIFLSKNRGINYVPDSINIHVTPSNSYNDTGKPIMFNAKNKTGVSDHLPMTARFIIKSR
jgi:endonuclease/exonuclease/phosphatase family metal-dependent hydrolase